MKKQPEGSEKMNSQRGYTSIIAIALLIVSLVIGVGLSAPTCYAIAPPPPPPGPTNETDIVIVETDVQSQLDKIYAWMMGHDTVMMGTRNMVREINGTLNTKIAELEELNSNIDALEATLETYSDRLNEEIGYFESRISSLQNTILFAYIAIAATVIGGFYFIKRMR